MRGILKGSTDQSVVIRIVDSADGTPETGVTSATSGLDLKYRREGAATANLTESDLSALTDAHSDGGMLHIGAGYYRVDVPDAAFATGANGVLIFGTVTGMVVIGAYHPLEDFCLAGQSAIDLKDFADDGYDPSTNKVQGVVLTDTVTTYTGNTPQTGDSFALIGATGSGLTTLATAAELAKVPKSDSNVSWNATAAAQIQSEANDALVANNLDHFIDVTGTVNDASAQVASFVTTLTGGADDFYKDQVLKFTSGALAGQARAINAWDDSEKRVLFDEPFTSAPANGVAFVLIPVHVHSLDDLGSNAWSYGTRTLTAGTNIQLPSNGLANVTAWTVDITGSLSGSVGSVTGAVGSVTGSVGSVVGAVGSVTGNVGGNVTGSVGSVVGNVGGTVASVVGAVGSVTGNVGGNVTGSVGSVTGLTASDVGAIKTKTDSLTFTGANRLDSNLAAIDNDTAGVTGLNRATKAITIGTVGSASTTTSIVTSSMTPAAVVADQFKGLILRFAKDTTTANLRGQATDITANTSGGILTVTALTTAPVSGDVFTVE